MDYQVESALAFVADVLLNDHPDNYPGIPRKIRKMMVVEYKTKSLYRIALRSRLMRVLYYAHNSAVRALRFEYRSSN